MFFFFFQAEDGIRDAQESRGLGDVYKRQAVMGNNQLVLASVRQAVQANVASSPTGWAPPPLSPDWEALAGGRSLGFNGISGCGEIGRVAAGLMAATAGLAVGEGVEAVRAGMEQLIGSDQGLVQARVRAMQAEINVGAQQSQFQMEEFRRLERLHRECKLHTQQQLQQAQQEWKRSMATAQRRSRVSGMIVEHLMRARLEVLQEPCNCGRGTQRSLDTSAPGETVLALDSPGEGDPASVALDLSLDFSRLNSQE
eukprot:TRINITY_DN56394_c0_g1_i2.p1 TRINITY_DN56394_c0_g1~~TRINITY_DN56394_c0_g1_i2.p1  ORF type:complete len:255 (+),score=69.50 TRINITY_DN56394_c0_g1_i2:55-819(+)